MTVTALLSFHGECNKVGAKNNGVTLRYLVSSSALPVSRFGNILTVMCSLLRVNRKSSQSSVSMSPN